MRKQFYYLLTISVLLTNLSIAQSTSSRSRLKKITYSDGSTRQFTYDSNGKLTREELTHNGKPTSQIQHTAGSNGKLASYSTRYQSPETPWNYGYTEDYGYDPSGRLVAKKHYTLRQGTTADSPVKALAFTDSLKYNAAGQVVSRRRYAYGMRGAQVSKTATSLTTSEYKYDGSSNLLEEATTTIPLTQGLASSVGKIQYEYDTKRNPFNLTGSPIFDQAAWSRNNCVKMTAYNSGSGSVPNPNAAKPLVTEYSYVYKNDLPVKRVCNNSLALSEAYEYESY